jgi:hypothetical protein
MLVPILIVINYPKPTSRANTLTHMQYPDKHTCNVCLKKTYETLGTKLATYVYNHCNISIDAMHLLAAWMKMDAYRRGAQRRYGARCYGMARRSPMWSSSAAQTSTGSAVGGWSADVMGATSPSRGTRGATCGASGGGFRPTSRGDAERASGRRGCGRDPFYERARSVQTDALKSIRSFYKCLVKLNFFDYSKMRFVFWMGVCRTAGHFSCCFSPDILHSADLHWQSLEKRAGLRRLAQKLYTTIKFLNHSVGLLYTAQLIQHLRTPQSIIVYSKHKIASRSVPHFQDHKRNL